MKSFALTAWQEKSGDDVRMLPSSYPSARRAVCLATKPRIRGVTATEKNSVRRLGSLAVAPLTQPGVVVLCADRRAALHCQPATPCYDSRRMRWPTFCRNRVQARGAAVLLLALIYRRLRLVSLQIERRRNRGTEEGGAQSNSIESSRHAKGMAFQLSSDGARGGGFMAGQQSCCA